MEQEHLLTVREVAHKLGVHYNTLKRIPSDDLPFFKVSKRGDRRYRPEDVEAFLSQRYQGKT